MNIIPIIIFTIGCIFGAFGFWFFNRKTNESVQQNRENLKAEFGDLSKQALDQNLDSFYFNNGSYQVYNLIEQLETLVTSCCSN